MTGGDKMTVRPMYEAPIEVCTEYKPFINTNHLPRVMDDTIFTSGRMKIIPFNCHFAPKEQDKTLKQFFKQRVVKSAILNWLVEGYRLMLEFGFDEPDCVSSAIAEYRTDADTIGNFLRECTVPHEKYRLPTTELYMHYARWSADYGYKPLNNRNFVGELRKRCEMGRDCAKGNIVIGLALNL
jgi:putative DNA primase/helicase